MLINYTILFVEDDEKIRKNYSEVLRDRFVKVYEADNGLSAYDIYLKQKPDIMIIDIDIPKLNGLELLKKIRQTDLNTKAIMLTSYSDKETLLKAMSLKLIQYLVKPVERKKLFEALDMAMIEAKEFNISSNKLFEFKDNYYWNFLTKELCENGAVVPLTKSERNILDIILSNALKKKITTYDELLYIQWSEYTPSSMNSLKTTIKILRRKLPPETILNLHGQGYKLQ